MATPIRIKRSAVPGKRPQVADLLSGELALNTHDGRLYASKDNPNVGIGTTVTLLTPWTENIDGSIYYTDGSVGIGTTNAQNHALFVDGSVNITENINVSGVSTFVGVATFGNNLYIQNQLYVNGINISGGSSIGEDTTTRNILASGISTFVGAVDANGGIDVAGHTELDDVNISGFLTATNASFSGNVSIAGTLTYEDVTNIDSVGLVTARSGVRILDGGLTVIGVSTFSDALGINANIDVDGYSELDDVNISATLNVVGMSTFTGEIDANGGATIDNIQIGITGDNEIDTSVGNLTIDSAEGTVTIDDQLVVTGISTFNSNVDVDLSLNVDENLNVIGISTFVGVTTFKNDVYIDGDLYVSDDLIFDEFTARNTNVTGIATIRNANITGVATITNIIGIGATIGRIVSAGTSFAQLQVSGISTFNNGPVFIGYGTTTGTADQKLQVTGGAYVSGSVGVGTTNPRETLDVIGTVGVQASGSANRFQIQHNAVLNSLDFIFI